ncbi:hypothetical protein GQ457_12G010190 [Hibiscus cannabinus]
MAPPEIHVLSADEEQVLETQTFANKRVNVCLNETNYLLWKQQLVLTIRGLELEGFMDGYVPVPSKIARNRGGEEVSNPLYLQYIKQDSSLASWLLSTVSPHILPQLVGSETTAGIWKTITDKYSNLSTTKFMNFHCRLRSMKKGTQSVTEYAMVIKQTFSILVDVETRMEDLTRFPIGINYTKYNGKHVANNGEESVVDSQDLSRSTANHDGRYKGRTRPQCQLCGKLGHLVDRCWHRFDQSYKAEPIYAPFVSQGVQEVEPDEDAQVNSLMVDGPTAYSKWFPYSGATHHVTRNITNLRNKAPYSGKGKVHLGDGTNLHINHVGNSFLSSNDNSIYLDKVLFVPQITKNLMSVAKCTKDNIVFFEFHSNVFYIKDSNSKKVFLQGKLDGGLYSFECCQTQYSAEICQTTVKTDAEFWLRHKRLGHTAADTIRMLNKIAPTDKSSVCVAYQMGKSHVLPFPTSSTVYTKPFELVEIDV